MKEYGILIVKPPSLDRIGVVSAICEMIEEIGLEIGIFKRIEVSQAQAADLYAKHEEKDYFPWLIRQITSGPAGLFLISGEDVARKLRIMAGLTLPEMARIKTPSSIRAKLTPEWESSELARLEKRAVDNVVHTSDPDEPGAVQREGAIFFPMYFQP